MPWKTGKNFLLLRLAVKVPFDFRENHSPDNYVEQSHSDSYLPQPTFERVQMSVYL